MAKPTPPKPSGPFALARPIVLGSAAILVAIGLAAGLEGPNRSKSPQPTSSPTVGTVTVVSSPPVPTQVLIDGHIADSWGVTGVALAAGTHTISFTHVPGYVDPAPQIVTVTAGGSLTVTGTFVATGWLRVMTSPAVASRITVDGAPADDWGDWTDFAVGSHQVCFGAVPGYTAPPCQSTSLTGGNTTTVTGTFVPNSGGSGLTGLGTLRVMTSPALPADVIITPQGGSPTAADMWGLNWLQLVPGTYSISFTHVPGYTEPAPQTVSIAAGAETDVTGTFQQRGMVRVTTSPALGATISVDGNTADAWGVWTDLPTGAHQVCFGAVTGYTTPACQSVTIGAGVTTTITGTYALSATGGTWTDVSPAQLSFNFNNPANNFAPGDTIAVDPVDQSVYLGTDYQGLWKSSDHGATWAKINTGTNGAQLDVGRIWALAIDPSGIIYAFGGGYTTNGIQELLRSTDGGVNWTILPTLSLPTQDLHSIEIDPHNASHLLISYHYYWPGLSDAGISESFDSGQTWTQHQPVSGWGAGGGVFFLDDPTGATWLVDSPNNGLWRTTNRGGSWTSVDSGPSSHGGANGLVRVGSNHFVMVEGTAAIETTNDGSSWTDITSGLPYSYYESVATDGTNLYTAPAFPTFGDNGAAHGPWYVRPISGGTWTAVASSPNTCNVNSAGTTQCNGPFDTAFDSVNRISYSANGLGGVWRLQGTG